MASRLTKIELEQHNTQLAAENQRLRAKNAELEALLDARGPVYVSAIPSFRMALDRLAAEYPERRSFTQTEVMAKVRQLQKRNEQNADRAH